jgi:molecular chaperone DnaJ
MAPADHYATLGVHRQATADEIKKAFRRLARELHPDTNPDPAAAERFKEVARAYEVLSDPERRRRYDTFGDDGTSAAAGDPFGFGGGGLGDIFDAFFGGGSGFGTRGGGPAGPPRGTDLEIVTEIDFETAVFGGEHDVTVRTASVCDACEATGAATGTSPTTCADCGGSGQVRRVRQSILGQMVTAGPCPRCGGLGQVVEHPCPACRGEGRRIGEKTYTVDIPAGVDTGSTLRLSGRGAAGVRGGGQGDLFVHLKVRPHPSFERRGYDLVHEVRLPFAMAALGGEVTLELLDGTETLTVSRGTPTGRVFRLRGRGVPHVEGRGRGDVLTRVEVEVPTELSAEEEQLLRRFAELRDEPVAEPETGLLSKIRSAFK